jgi:hypothetical protein
LFQKLRFYPVRSGFFLLGRNTYGALPLAPGDPPFWAAQMNGFVIGSGRSKDHFSGPDSNCGEFAIIKIFIFLQYPRRKTAKLPPTPAQRLVNKPKDRLPAVF